MKRYFILIGLLAFNFGLAQDMETLIEEALANNPEIQKFELQYKRVSEKVNEVNTIPNTEFGVGYFVSEPETRTGAQRFEWSRHQKSLQVDDDGVRDRCISIHSRVHHKDADLQGDDFK